MLDIVKRARRANPEVTAELLRRGFFRSRERAELLPLLGRPKRQGSMGPAQFAALLAQGDVQLAARAVLRGSLDAGELRWLDRMLRFQKLNGKREELARIVERALEGRKGNARK